MTTSRSVLLISAIALVLLALVPAVSAIEVIYDERLEEFIDTSKSGTQINDPGTVPRGGDLGVEYITFKEITKAQTIHYLIIEFPGEAGYWRDLTLIEPGRHDFTYHFNGKDRPGVLYLARDSDSTQFTIFLNDWDIGDLTGWWSVRMPFYFKHASINGALPWLDSNAYSDTNIQITWGFDGKPGRFPPCREPIKITEVTSINWKHHLKVLEDSTHYYIDIYGFIDGKRYDSEVVLKKGAEIYSEFTNPGEEKRLTVLKDNIDLIEIISPSGAEYAYPLFGDIPIDPDTSPVAIYVKSSQTGALLDNAHIMIKDTTTTPWTEVVNQTLSTGQGVVSLVKDRGFNPTQYQITVKVPGYQQVVPAQFFRVTGSMSVVVEMEPLEGGPVDEDNTFLEFYVTDLNGNGISNAQVYVGGQMRWTNAEGYTQFEVAKNTGYSYTVSKSGYVTVRGSATVGDGPRYTVNVVLGPETVPTQPPGTDPGTSLVNVYVKSSQTGALLADARVIIQDTRTDPWTEVVNQTLPSGQGTFSLAKDPGFNPTQYHISATVPGYQQVVPALFFRVTGPTNVVVEMEPIEGGPVDENNTFLEFYVRNLDDNPVSNAMVSVAGQTRWTNAQGWTQFEVAKNASYPYTVSKSGYATIEGSATVADGPRYVVNVVLGPKDIPTQPPGVPTLEPTPPGGVPGDDDSEGFLMEAIRGISRAFGVGFATGKTIFGMLLALAIGFATAKQLRGGAAEFGLGLLGGTMLGVLIGLIPIWVIVVLLLIVGMYIGYRYVGGSSNG